MKATTEGFVNITHCSSCGKSNLAAISKEAMFKAIEGEGLVHLPCQCGHTEVRKIKIMLPKTANQ